MKSGETPPIFGVAWELLSQGRRPIGNDVVNIEDRQLIDQCKAGDTNAYGQLVIRYQDRLFNAITKILDHADDAMDVAQEAFVTAYQSLATFKGESEFYTWLYRIAFNLAMTSRRKKRAIVSLDAGERSDALNPVDQSLDHEPGRALERTEDENQVHLAISKLSLDHRAVLILKDLEGQKYEEISEVLNIPVGTVRSRLFRARLELRQLLAHMEE